GYLDGDEIIAGSNPGNSASTPGGPIPASPFKLIAGQGPYALHGGGMELMDNAYAFEAWKEVNWPDYNAAGGAARIASGDVDGDGKDEIIVGLGSIFGAPALPGGYFELLDDDFTHLAWGRIQWPDYNTLNGECWPTTGDVDGDGKYEIILGLGPGGEGMLEIFNYTAGELIHQTWVEIDWADYNLASGEIRPAGGDVDGDGKDEIIVGLGPVPGSASLPDGYFDVLDDDFTLLGSGRIDWLDYNTLNGESRPAAGDLDGDGKSEIIMGLGGQGGGALEIFKVAASSVVHHDWVELSFTDYNDVHGETRPAAGDADQDGIDELFIGLGVGGDGWIEILDDAGQQHTLLDNFQCFSQEYNDDAGETWPSVIKLQTP
ncbi:MAG: hypothetical protein GY859_28425, partial [Desulfobacterales bacterium]|nr:hypothetical protein [Desulfobacterales bacterium]